MAGGRPGIRGRPGLIGFILGAFGGNVAIWGSLFAGAETLAASGASALEVQLMAFASALPLIGGGLAVRRFVILPAVRVRVLCWLTAGLGAILILLGAALGWGAPVGLVYVAGAVSGIGQLAKMTLYRPELFARAGSDAPRGLGLDSLLFSAAVLLGPFCMGFLLTWGGPRLAFMALGLGYASSAWVTMRVGRVAPWIPATHEEQDPQVSHAGGSPRRYSALKAILAVTVIFNLFYLPLQGLVPLLSRQFTNEPWQVGILASAAGLGMLTGNSVISMLRSPRLAALFLGGVPVALLGSVTVSQVDSYWLAFAALAMGGVGGSGFAATQAALVLRHTPARGHSAAMGLVSVAISVLPVGALMSGTVSQAFGTSLGFLLSGVVGLTVWLLMMPVCWPRLVVARDDSR
jgi:hypothetical protein